MVRQRFESWGRSPLFWAALSTLLLILYGALSLARPQISGLRVFGLVGAIFTLGCAATAAILVSRTGRRAEASRAWRFLAISLSLWVIADVLAAAAFISSGASLAQPSLSDLVRLAGFLAAIPALGSYPVLPAERFSRARESLDVAILCLSVLALAWLIVIRSILDVGVAGPIQAFWVLVSPVANLMLFTLLVRLVLLSFDPDEQLAFSLIGFACLLLSGLEFTAGYTQLLDVNQAGASASGGRMLAGLIMFLAILVLQDASVLPAHHAPARQRSLRGRLEAMLPIGFTYLVVGSTALDWRLSGKFDAVGVATAVLLCLLLVARQGVIAGQVEFRQFAALVNTSADMAFVAGSDGRLILRNPALIRNLHIDTRIDHDLHLAEFILADRPVQDIISEAIDEGWSGEGAFRRSDSTTFPVYLTLRPVYDERRSRPLLAAIAHDLTRIKERERALHRALDEVATARRDLEALNRDLEKKVEARTDQLEQMVRDLNRLNQDLKELDRLKTEFVALVSHELRTPLTNIQTGVELILASYPKLNRGARESIELVQAETGRLTEFVESILDLSALEAGRFPLQPAKLDLAIVAAEVVDRFFDRKDRQRLKLQLPAGLATVEADGRALSSVLFHLIDNALKYAPAGVVLIDGYADAEAVVIRVSDNGPGIPEEERERVFEMFHRLDSSDSREIYGHGLGLHLVRQLVEAMRGSVRIEGAPGGGARVLVRLKPWA